MSLDSESGGLQCTAQAAKISDSIDDSPSNSLGEKGNGKKGTKAKESLITENQPIAMVSNDSLASGFAMDKAVKMGSSHTENTNINENQSKGLFFVSLLQE